MSNETKNRKLRVALVATAGLLVPAFASTVHAQEQWQSVATTVIKADPNDTARTRTENGVTRLRATDQEQPGFEMPCSGLGSDGIHGIIVGARSGALPSGELPKFKMQGACIPFALAQGADGAVSVQADSAKARFLTKNDGNETRNFNQCDVLPINGGKNFLVTYNYQPNNTNDTKRFARVVDAQCNDVTVKNGQGQVQDQVVFMAKNNDDCSGQQGGGACEVVKDENGKVEIICGHLCNGNGRDDSWMGEHHVDCKVDANGQATECAITRPFDVATCLNEERSRPKCTTSADDPNTAICTCTDGNSQPQRRGVWMFAIDRSPGGQQGADAKSRLLWAEQIGAKETIQGKTTYSMRIVQERLMVPDATGNLVRSPYIVVQWNKMVGNNDRKGVALAFSMGVAKPTKTGLEWVIPPTNTTDMMNAVDGTHLNSINMVVGNNGTLMPAIGLHLGTQFGGSLISPSADKVIGIDLAGKKFVDLGLHSTGAQYDRHLYPNYLGNNPRNQGRNFADSMLVKNPFYGQNGNKVQYYVAQFMTGKATDMINRPEIKLDGFATMMAVAVDPPAAPPPATTPPANDNTGNNNATPGTDNGATPPAQGTPDDEAQDPAAGASPSMMGCTAAPGGAGTGSALLIGLAFGLVAIIRRRRA